MAVTVPKDRSFAFLRPDRMAVAAERCIEYTALSTGCRALLAFLTTFGVTARFTARRGCIARRTLSGTNSPRRSRTGRWRPCQADREESRTGGATSSSAVTIFGFIGGLSEDLREVPQSGIAVDLDAVPYVLVRMGAGDADGPGDRHRPARRHPGALADRGRSSVLASAHLAW